jgi:hypothetical protein
MQGLTRAKINPDLIKRCDMALYFLKTSGKFDASVCKWENKPAAQKTWANIKLSSRLNTHTRTNRTNSQQSNSKPTSLKNKLR